LRCFTDLPDTPQPPKSGADPLVLKPAASPSLNEKYHRETSGPFISFIAIPNGIRTKRWMG
jgi:hypothetical protein